MLSLQQDAATIRKLLSCVQEVELRDESGQVLARLTPDAEYREKMLVKIRASFDEESIARGREQKGVRTLAEVMRDLGMTNGTLHGHDDAGSHRPVGANLDERG